VTNDEDNIEFIVTIRCKVCGEIYSLGQPLSFDEATDTVEKFTGEHLHRNVNPWVI